MSREVDSDLAMLNRLVAPEGKDLVDIGCGGGALVRELSDRGARMIGVEVSESQLRAALDRDPGGAARYLVGRAESLPIEDDSLDAALFMRSLHHVPPEKLMRALAEARRVIHAGGLVYVVEPLAEGDYYELMSLVEDEVEARAAAQDALERASRSGLDRQRTVEYDVRMKIADLAMLRTRIVSVDPDRAERFDARYQELATAFERLGAAGGRPGERWFMQPMRADVLRPS
jgi:SAM-dependent methyltransferase